MNARVFVSIAALGAALSGCNWTVFDDLRDQASTLVFDEPDDYRTPNYGTNLAAVTGTRPEGTVSRLGVNAGADSTTAFFEGWNGTSMVLRSLTEICRFDDDCEEPIATSLIGLPRWGGDGELCFMAAGGGFYFVKCEIGDTSDKNRFGSVGEDVSSIGLGTSLASLVDGVAPNDPVGVAVAGAPLGNAGAGDLYRIEDGGNAVVIPVPAGVLGAGSGLGSTVAGTRRAGDEFVAAATAPGNPPAIGAQVLVFALAAGGTELRACLEPPAGAEASGFGKALAFGDVDGDDVPDLVVGSDADASIKAERVWIYRGSDYPAAAGAGCQGWGADPLVVECLDDLRGVSCSNNGFGDALAVGDVDGDGIGDLLVGAPLSDVGGAGSSGAVYVYPGKTGGPVTEDGSILVDSSPESDEEIGRSVVALPSDLDGSVMPRRAEVIAGAPRASRWYAFLCTAPELGDASLGVRCQPTAP